MAARKPLFEFVIRTTLASYDLDTAEGRVAALRAAAPVVAGIRDRALQPEYTRRLAGWLGMEPLQVQQAVAQAARAGQNTGAARAATPRQDGPPPMDPETGAIAQVSDGQGKPERRDPVVRQEALSLGVLLQMPDAVAQDSAALQIYRELTGGAFTVPQYRAIFDAVVSAGGPRAGAGWVDVVAEEAGESLAPMVSELSVTPLPHDNPARAGEYARSVLARMLDFVLTREISAARGSMQRAGQGSDDYQASFAAIVELEKRRRALRDA
jgi:DNA primase